MRERVITFGNLAVAAIAGAWIGVPVGMFLGPVVGWIAWFIGFVLTLWDTEREYVNEERRRWEARRSTEPSPKAPARW